MKMKPKKPGDMISKMNAKKGKTVGKKSTKKVVKSKGKGKKVAYGSKKK